MSIGKNPRYLRQLSGNMTQEVPAEKLDVSRRTVSKWETDKTLELYRIFNCPPDHLFRDDMDKRSKKYTSLRIEKVPGFRYVEYTVISTDPENDAIAKVYRPAKENGDDKPKVIGGILRSFRRSRSTHTTCTAIPPIHFFKTASKRAISP